MSRTHLLSGTLALYHQDHPRPAGILTADDPWPVLREQARRHEWNRLQSVAETLALVSLLAATRVISLKEPVTVGKAIYQVGRGSKHDQIAAAHCLPGHLIFGSDPLHRLPDWKPQALENAGLKALPVALKLRGLFGRTDFVDRSVNEADSFLEILDGGKGLKPQFGHSTEHLMRLVAKAPGQNWKDLQRLAADAMSHYRDRSKGVYVKRLADLRSKARQAANDDEVKSIQRKSFIIETMLEVLGSREYGTDDVEPCGFAKIIEEVVRLDQHPKIPSGPLSAPGPR